MSNKCPNCGRVSPTGIVGNYHRPEGKWVRLFTLDMHTNDQRYWRWQINTTRAQIRADALRNWQRYARDLCRRSGSYSGTQMDLR